ncbi:PHP domain-containing protein [Acutalibacter caecimuris]|uniref:PHP domain-containing protein n=1 Tax=Acutalibacter caecimuris TaxID=3093657 RepID=UPI002AC8E1B7|nr:PHP domain-containing protein [Acutalibacter sp. M00118]
MREYAYDLHIHSCLSPCGDNDMTPNNLVGMAAMMGLEVIAITDHNTCKNAPAVMQVAKEAGILAVPGMELCTAEEAHVVCLFETLEGAMDFDRYIEQNMPHIQNKAEIFGEQRILDANDQMAGTLDSLLLVASSISADQVKGLCQQYGGTAFPAHVDRDSYSVIASLGSIPPEGGYTVAEVTRECDLAALQAQYPELKGMGIVRDSDSHYLEALATSEARKIALPERSAAALLEVLGTGAIRCAGG